MASGQWTPRRAARELQLPPAADEAAVKKRYRELAREHHPDRNPCNKEAATAAFQRISGAYDRLSDDFGVQAERAAAAALNKAAAAAARRQAACVPEPAPPRAVAPSPPCRHRPAIETVLPRCGLHHQ